MNLLRFFGSLGLSTHGTHISTVLVVGHLLSLVTLLVSNVFGKSLNHLMTEDLGKYTYCRYAWLRPINRKGDPIDKCSSKNSLLTLKYLSTPNPKTLKYLGGVLSLKGPHVSTNWCANVRCISVCVAS